MNLQRDISPDAYRRSARRLRSDHARNPLRLHQGLRDLSRSYDDAAKQPLRDAEDKVVSPSAPEASGIRAFRAAVENRLQNGLLSYSNRLHLLRDAQCRGIGRFEANLIIAAVQHQSRYFPPVDSTRRRRFQWSGAIVFLVVQSLVFAGLWWLLRT